MQEIPILVIAFFDLQNTTTQVKEITSLLEEAYNKKVCLIPIKMEMINQIYFRDINLNTYRGAEYGGLTDDKRAIRAFIGDAFKLCSHILKGRTKIIVYHSSDYEVEAKMMETLIQGLHLHSELERTDTLNL